MQSYGLIKGETVEVVETRSKTTKKNLQKPVPRATVAYDRQLKMYLSHGHFLPFSASSILKRK